MRGGIDSWSGVAGNDQQVFIFKEMTKGKSSRLKNISGKRKMQEELDFAFLSFKTLVVMTLHNLLSIVRIA